MAALIRRPAGNHRTRRVRRYTPMAQINVTPLVDVMLVLLIIFMVAAPLLTVGVPVDLPETEASALPEQHKPLTISVDREGHIYLGEDEVTLDALTERLRELAGTAKAEAQPVFIRGDKSASYGAMMKVMARLDAAGFRKLSLIAELERQQ